MQSPRLTPEEARKAKQEAKQKAVEYFQSKKYKGQAKSRTLFGVSLMAFGLPVIIICYFLHLKLLYVNLIAFTGSFVVYIVLSFIFNRSKS